SRTSSTTHSPWAAPSPANTASACSKNAAPPPNWAPTCWPCTAPSKPPSTPPASSTPARSSDPETARRARTRPPGAPPSTPPALSRHGSHRQPVHRPPRLHHHARPLRRAGHHRVIELAHRQRTHRRPARRQRLHTPRQPRRQPGRVHPVVHHLAHRRRTIGIHQHRQLRHQTAALLQHVEHRRLPQPPPVQVRGIQEIGDVVDVPLLLERVQNRVVGI